MLITFHFLFYFLTVHIMVRRSRNRRVRSRRSRYAVPRNIGGVETRNYILRYNQEIFSNNNSFEATTFTVPDDPRNAPEWSQLTPLYQLYRINAIKIHFNPSYTVNQTSAAIDAYNRPIYVIHDTNDSEGSNFNVGNLWGYRRLAIFNTLKSFSYFTRMKRRLNMASSTVTSTDGYISTTSPVQTQKIVLHVPGINLSALSYGILTVSFYCTFRVRR